MAIDSVAGTDANGDGEGYGHGAAEKPQPEQLSPDAADAAWLDDPHPRFVVLSGAGMHRPKGVVCELGPRADRIRAIRREFNLGLSGDGLSPASSWEEFADSKADKLR